MRTIIQVKKPCFKYLWLKAITGFDPEKHCARSLEGVYLDDIPFGPKRQGDFFVIELNPAAAPFFYLCGVTSKWADNVHVPFVHAPGETVEFETDSIRVKIKDARMLDIPEVATNKPKAFSTCRNWRFGMTYLAPVEA